MKFPDWFTLIERWVPEGLGDSGITLPFLVGALAFKNGFVESNLSEVEKVLDEICNKPVDGYVIEVSDCLKIDVPVLKATRCDVLRMDTLYAIAHPSGKGQSLVFGSNLTIYWQTSDPAILLAKLAKDAAQYTEKGQYSRRFNPVNSKYEYGDFTENEIAYIKRVIINS